EQQDARDGDEHDQPPPGVHRIPAEAHETGFHGPQDRVREAPQGAADAPERRHAAGAHEPAGERDQRGEAEGREYDNPKDRVRVVHGLKLRKAWGVGSGEWYSTVRNGCSDRAVRYHSPLPTSLRCEDVYPVRLGEPRLGAAPDHVDPAAQRGRAQTMPGDGQGRADAPPVRRRIVDLVVVKHGRASLAAERVDATVEHGGGESAAPRGHGGLPRPAVAGGVIGLDDVEVAARVEWAAADRVDQAARGSRGEVI